MRGYGRCSNSFDDGERLSYNGTECKLSTPPTRKRMLLDSLWNGVSASSLYGKLQSLDRTSPELELYSRWTTDSYH